MDYILKLTEQQLGLISAGLQELPFKLALPLIQDLQKQVADQPKPVGRPRKTNGHDQPSTSGDDANVR